MDKIFKVAFVGGDKVPLLDIKGGAIQTLVTALIRENEKKGKCLIDVYTCDDPLLSSEMTKYRSTNIIPVKKSNFQMIYNTIWRIIRKTSNYHIESRSRYMNKVNRLINKNDYDYVIFESTERQVREYKKNNNTILCFHVHAAFLNTHNTQDRKVISKCDIMIGVSDFISNSIRIEGSKQNIVTLKNAVDVKQFIKVKNDIVRKKIREQFHYTDNDKVVVYCGRLSKEKGCLELVKAIANVNCKLLIIGGENFSSNKITPYVKEIQTTISSISDRVTLTGYVPHNEIPMYLAAADIGVVPSVCDEAASLTLVEMHAAGLPVIASNRGGIPEYSSNKNTIYVNTDDHFIDNLSKVISELKYNDRMYDELKMHALDGIDEYDYSFYYDRFIDFLKNNKKGAV